VNAEAPPIKPPIDVTVITLDSVDYGAGKTDRIVFRECKYRVDENNTLHVYKVAGGADGNVATFAYGQWASVIRGQVTSLNHDLPASEHTLKIVNTP
jgi:hypothetical protein